MHKEKFDEMGQQFQTEEIQKAAKTLKRKTQIEIVNTSTPAKRFIGNNVSLAFNTLNTSDSMLNRTDNYSSQMFSQASSGYFSQNSAFSDDF